MAQGGGAVEFTGLGEVKKLNIDGSVVLAAKSSDEKEILVPKDLLERVEIEYTELSEGDTLYYESETLRNAGTASCHEIALRVSETVDGTGVISRTEKGFAIMKTDDYGDIFVPGSSVNDVYPASTFDLTKLFRIGDELHFVAWDQYFTDSKITLTAPKSNHKTRYRAESVWFPLMEAGNNEKYGVIFRILSQEAAIAFNKPTGRILILKDHAANKSQAKMAFGDRIIFQLDTYSAMTARKTMGCRFQASTWRPAPNLIYKKDLEKKGGFSKVASHNDDPQPGKGSRKVKKTPNLPVGMTPPGGQDKQEEQYENRNESKLPINLRDGNQSNQNIHPDTFDMSSQDQTSADGYPTSSSSYPKKQTTTFNDPFDNGEPSDPPFNPQLTSQPWSAAVKNGPLGSSNQPPRRSNRPNSPPQPSYDKWAEEMEREWSGAEDEPLQYAAAAYTKSADTKPIQPYIPGLSPSPERKENPKSSSSSLIADREVSQITRDQSVSHSHAGWLPQPHELQSQPAYLPSEELPYPLEGHPVQISSPPGFSPRNGSGPTSVHSKPSSVTDSAGNVAPTRAMFDPALHASQLSRGLTNGHSGSSSNGQLMIRTQDVATQTDQPLLEVQIVNKIVSSKELMSLICAKHPELIQALLTRH